MVAIKFHNVAFAGVIYYLEGSMSGPCLNYSPANNYCGVNVIKLLDPGRPALKLLFAQAATCFVDL